MNKHAARRLVLMNIRKAAFSQVTATDRAIRFLDFPTPEHQKSAMKSWHKWRSRTAIVWLLTTFWDKAK